MNAQEVTHLWANESRNSARSGNVSFEGRTLYSYAAPIAKLVTVEGRRAVLINPRKFSVTTSKHQSWARGASCHLTRLEIDSRNWPYGKNEFTREQWEAMSAEQDKRNAENAEWEKQAKREAAKRRRDAEKARKAAIEAFPLELEAWRNGGKLPALASQFPTALRLSPDGFTIETSRHARVPARAARKVWPVLREAVAKETENPRPAAWNPFFSAPDFKWGDYTGVSLRRIAIGSPIELIVGCHTIPWREVEDIAARLGLIETLVEA